MKTMITKKIEDVQTTGTFKIIRERTASNRLFTYALELVLLYVLVFAAMSTFAQEPAVAIQQPGKLDFTKQTIVFNSGKVYLNWVTKNNSSDCIYVIERSIDGSEYEPVGLKEGIGSPLELLYSWVDNKPVAGESHYRIKQIDNEGKLVAEADPKTISTPENNPILLERSSRMVQVK